MNTHKKAKELIFEFMNKSYPFVKDVRLHQPLAKCCALICVDEILKMADDETFYAVNAIGDDFIPIEDYWKKVREEIQKL